MAARKPSRKSAKSPRWKRWSLNLALAAALGVLAVLAYALGGRLLEQRRPAPAPASAAPAPVVQVEVVNGCGVPGLAADVRSYLRAAGFDVVGVGDARPYRQKQTLVIDRGGGPEAARRVAAALGVASERVQHEPRPEEYLDASVVLGMDYKTLKPFMPE